MTNNEFYVGTLKYIKSTKNQLVYGNDDIAGIYLPKRLFSRTSAAPAEVVMTIDIPAKYSDGRVSVVGEDRSHRVGGLRSEEEPDFIKLKALHPDWSDEEVNNALVNRKG